MRIFAHEEKIEMILITGECKENCLLASRVHPQNYPEIKHPDKRSVETLLQTFCTTLSMIYKKVRRQKPVAGNENEFLIIDSLVENSQNKLL